MSEHLWVIPIAVIASITGIIEFVLSSNAAQRERRVATATSGFGIVLTADVTPQVTALVVGRMRAGAVGGISAILLAALFIGFFTTPSEFPVSLVSLIPMFSVGRAIGVAVAALAFERRRVMGQHRVARLRPVSIRDYAPLWQWMLLTGLIGAAIVVLAGLIYATARSGSDALSTGAMTMIGLGVAAFAVSLVLSARVVRKASASASPNELAWDDALRGAAIQDSMLAPLVLALTGLGWGLIALNQHRGAEIAPISLVTIALAVTIGIVSIVLYTRARPAQQYLRRLWPSVIPPMVTALPAATGVHS